MTQEQAKAEALAIVEQFKPHVTDWDCYWDSELSQEEILQNALPCAIIYVNGMLKEYAMLNERPEAINRFVHRPDYWNKIIEELNKMKA